MSRIDYSKWDNLDYDTSSEDEDSRRDDDDNHNRKEPPQKTQQGPCRNWMFFHAAKDGDLEKLAQIQSEHPDINIDEPNRLEPPYWFPGGAFLATPLVAAITNGHAHIVDYLVDSGATIDGDHQLRNALFHAAIAMENEEITRLLLQLGADVNLEYQSYFADDGPTTTLQTLLNKRMMEMILVVTEESTTLTSESLDCIRESIQNTIASTSEYDDDISDRDAMVDRDIAFVRFLIQLPQVGTNYVYQEMSPLGMAALYSTVDMIDMLVENGAVLDSVHEDLQLPHQNPLACAVSSCQEDSDRAEIVKCLLDHGASPNALILEENGTESTPLLGAVQMAPLSTIKYMMEHHGAKWQYRSDKSRPPPLHLACHFGRSEVVNYLVEEQGADIKQSFMGLTPLELACNKGHLDTIYYITRRFLPNESLTHGSVSELVNTMNEMNLSGTD